MPSNVYMKSALLTAAGVWVRLAETSTVINAKFIVQPIGVVPADSAINVRYSGAQQCEWPMEATVELTGVDIAEFEFAKVSSSARVLVVGYTR